MTKAEILQELRGEVRVYRESYKKEDGIVKDAGALRTIAALKAAIKIVRKSPCVASRGSS